MELWTMLLVTALAMSAEAATDYCSADLCHGLKHIACKHNGKFASSCPSDAAMVTMTDELKTLLVRAHNEKRDLVASGAVPQHDAACRMATMKWDDELAALAALNVRQCAMKHDACRNTATFRQSGQNLFWITYFNAPKYKEKLKTALDSWFSERKYSNMDYVRSFPQSTPKPIGHFTAIVNDKNTHVGCGAATYTVKDANFKALLLACNYATNNMLGEPVYENCPMPGMLCSSGYNPQYKHLCAESTTKPPKIKATPKPSKIKTTPKPPKSKATPKAGNAIKTTTKPIAKIKPTTKPKIKSMRTEDENPITTITQKAENATTTSVAEIKPPIEPEKESIRTEDENPITTITQKVENATTTSVAEIKPPIEPEKESIRTENENPITTTTPKAENATTTTTATPIAEIKPTIKREKRSIRSEDENPITTPKIETKTTKKPKTTKQKTTPKPKDPTKTTTPKTTKKPKTTPKPKDPTTPQKVKITTPKTTQKPKTNKSKTKPKPAKPISELYF